MAIACGVTPQWTIRSDEGRKHAATKSIVQDSIILNYDAGVIDSYGGTGSTWTDLTGNNNLTLYNSPAFTSDNGGVLSFDGANSYAANTSLSGAITSAGQSYKTFCCFANLNTVSAWPTDSIFRLNSTSSTSYQLFFSSRNFSNTRTLSAGYYSGDGGGSPAVLNYTHDGSIYGDYHMYTVRLYDNVIDLFIDEELVASGSPKISTAKDATIDNIVLGNSLITDSSFLQGSISSAVLYLKKLSNTEIKQNYNVMRHRFGV